MCQMSQVQVKGQYTWEEAISILRRDPASRDMIYQAYLTEDLPGNCRRFASGAEFAETLKLLQQHAPGSRAILDMPGGNGIATVAFCAAGYLVTSVEPDPSETVGRGAIKTALVQEGLTAEVIDSFGETLPFPDGCFDVAYVRQGLHHARNLPAMVAELARVLVPGGVLLAVREHVVDNYGRSLEAFLRTQIDHDLYGGENAFTLEDYRAAFLKAKVGTIAEWGPYDSVINMYPFDVESLHKKILQSAPGRMLRSILPAEIVCRIGMSYLRCSRAPGRLYSFMCRKPVD